MLTSLGVCILLILLWLVLLVLAPPESMSRAIHPFEVSHAISQSQTDQGRGYGYNGINPLAAYPIIPFLEPIVIIAGLAFLSFLIQALHVLFLSHHSVASPVAQRPNLVGGVVDSLVPTRLRSFQRDQLQDLLTAFNLQNEHTR